MPRKFGFEVFVDRKIIDEVLNVTDTWIESPKLRELAQVVGAVQPEQVAEPLPSEVPLSLTVTVRYLPHPLVIVGDPLATIYDATSLGCAHSLTPAKRAPWYIFSSERAVDILYLKPTELKLRLIISPLCQSRR